MPYAISHLIGSTNKHAVHRGRSAVVGRQPRHVIRTSSKSSSLTRHVDLVHCGLSVRSPGDEPSPCEGAKPTKRSKLLVSENGLRILHRCMTNERGSKALMLREFAAWACAVPAILANRARIFNMWQPPPPSICVGYMIG